MSIADRRTLLQTAAALPFAMTAASAASAQTPAAAPSEVKHTAPAKDVTRTLANYIVAAKYDDLPANVRKEGVRTLLNWVAGKEQEFRVVGLSRPSDEIGRATC